MSLEIKTHTLIDFGCGILLQIAGGVLMRMSGIAVIPGLTLLLLGAWFLILGCTGYASAKGYSMWIGLLGSFSVLGLIILFLLPHQLEQNG